MNFNPRSSKRSDMFTIFITSRNAYFNPRSYKRSDIMTEKGNDIESQFQSTLLQEERRLCVFRNVLKK